MRIAIDITEAINGWRLDIIEDLGQASKTRRENVETQDQAFLYLKVYAEQQLRRKPPINTMDVI